MDNDDADLGQKTGWCVEVGWGRLAIFIQWLGFTYHWEAELANGAVITQWLGMYSSEMGGIGSLSFVASPLRISLCWDNNTYEEDEDLPET
jgi:hypothetical protein